METIKGLFQKEKISAMVLAKAIAIVVSFAMLYYFITNGTPTLSYTFGTDGRLAIRFGNALKALALWNPLSAMGLTTASFIMNYEKGRLFIGLYSFMALITQAGMGYLVYWLNNRGTKSHSKTLLLLTVWSFISALGVALNHAIIANGWFGIDLVTMFKTTFFFQLPGQLIATAVIGYPLYLAFNKVSEKFKK